MKKFRKFEGKKTVLNRKKTLGFFRPQFKWYLPFPVGVPLIVLLATVIITFIPKEMSVGIITPKIGEFRCGFPESKEFVPYLIVPAGIVLAFAFSFCLNFSWNYCCGTWYESKENKVVTIGRKGKAKVVIKVLILSGGLFTIDLVTSAVELAYGLQSTTFLSVSSALDWISYLQGFFLSLVIIINGRSIKRIKDQIRNLTSSSGTTWHSGTTATTAVVKLEMN
jgi:hypothetical protein